MALSTAFNEVNVKFWPLSVSASNPPKSKAWASTTFSSNSSTLGRSLHIYLCAHHRSSCQRLNAHEPVNRPYGGRESRSYCEGMRSWLHEACHGSNSNKASRNGNRSALSETGRRWTDSQSWFHVKKKRPMYSSYMEQHIHACDLNHACWTRDSWIKSIFNNNLKQQLWCMFVFFNLFSKGEWGGVVRISLLW